MPNADLFARFQRAAIVCADAGDSHVDEAVLASLRREFGDRPRLSPRDVDVQHPPTDLVVIGSPRFNAFADRVQQQLSLRCQYVSARAKGDAAARDEADSLAPAHRVLRLVTADGEELSASADHGHAGSVDGTDSEPLTGIDYGLIAYARFANGRQLLWISGIHAAGALGAAQVVREQAGRLEAAIEGVHTAEPFALTQIVRVTYGARPVAECLGDALLSRHTAPPRSAVTTTGGPAEPQAAVRGILFDLGDVVMKFDRDRSYRAIAQLHGSDYSSVRERIRQIEASTSLLSRFESGGVDTDTFIAQLADGLGASPALRERLADCWADLFWPNYETFEVLTHLKQAGYALGLVSNTNHVHFDHLARHYPEIMSLFDERSLSHEVGATKPDRAIFVDAIGKMARRGIDASALLYVDDLPRYVTAMRAFGVSSFLYRSHSHFVFWLRQHGVFVPTVG